MASKTSSTLNAPLAPHSERRFKVGEVLSRRWPWARWPRARWPWARIFLGLIVLVLAGASLRIALVDDPAGGRPSAEIPISRESPPNVLAGELSKTGPDGQTLLGQGPVPGNGAQITMLGESPADTFTEALDATGALADLVEQTQYGPIPMTSAQGLTPFMAYSRPVTVEAGAPRIAIVMTGLGLNRSSTAQAIANLPENVSMAFAPYGDQLETLVSDARRQGHELFLQLPMEPFDYPDNDPGPETLLTGQAPRANVEHLFALMARFGGYAGVTNYMGGRFTASSADFTPIMEELGTRGLGYLDDGSSNRSIAGQLAKANSVPFGQASVMLDAVPSRENITAALAQLEDQARQSGSALGVVSALPISIQTLTDWAETLERKGIQLVPVTALMH